MEYISSDTNVWLDFHAIDKTDLPFRLPCTFIMFKEALRSEIVSPPELLHKLHENGLVGVDITIEEFYYAIDLGNRYNKKYFVYGLEQIIKRLEPKRIVLYGAAPDSIFGKYQDQGIDILHFDSDFAVSRGKG